MRPSWTMAIVSAHTRDERSRKLSGVSWVSFTEIIVSSIIVSSEQDRNGRPTRFLGDHDGRGVISPCRYRAGGCPAGRRHKHLDAHVRYGQTTRTSK